MRAARWTALAAAAGGAAWLAFSPREVPAAELRADAEDACAASRFEDAVAICRRLTAEHPADAEGWLLLARSRRGAGQTPDEFIEDAERALAADPGNAAVRTFLARSEAARGRLAAAVAHAAAATSIAPDDAETWLLVADLEMRKPQPDLARVRDALERAHAGGLESRDADILLAEVSIRLNGAEGTGSERLPAGAAAALRRALAALDATRTTEKDPLAAGRTRARFLLALGQPEDAFAAAEAALARVPADTPASATADVRLLRAMALHSRGNRADALREFAEVLRDRPDAAAASAACAYLMASDDRTAARDLLTHAAESDPTGGIHAVLASALLATGDLDGAAHAIQAACTASPSDPFFAEIRGQVREAEGRLPQARAAYDEAVRLSDALLAPRVRRALLVLAETPPENAPPGAYDAALAELSGLKERFDDDPLLLAALGRLELARGDETAARAALEIATARRPSDAEAWLALAEARRRCGGAESLDGAADALARARRLRPTDPDLAIREAQAWVAADKPDVAVAACGEHLRRRPGDAGVLRTRADAYRRLGMWGLAAEDLRNVVRSGAAEPDDAPALALALVRSGDAVAANRLVDETGGPDGAGTARIFGHVAAAAREDGGALEKALAAAGPSPLLAWVRFTSGRRAEALDCLHRMDPDRAGDPRATRLLVTVLLDTDAMRGEDLAEARSVVTGLPESSPASLLGLVWGQLRVAENLPADAVEPLRAAATASAGDPLAALFLGEALWIGGDTAAALAAVRRAMSLSGEDPWIASRAARPILSASIACRDAAEAASLALEAFRLDPALVAAARRAAEKLHERGDFARAADAAESALATRSLSPEDEIDLRLVAAIVRGLDGESGAAQQAAAELPPSGRESWTAKLLRGLAELDAGHLDDAERLLAGVHEVSGVAALVTVSLRRGDVDTGLSRLEDWTAAHPEDRDVRLAIAAELLRLGRTDAAVTVAATCAARHPRDFAVARLYARATERSGKAAAAAAFPRTFAETAPPRDAVEARLAAAALAGRNAIDAEGARADARKVAEDAAAAPYVRALARATEAEILLVTDRTRDADNCARVAIALLARTDERGRPERRIESRARRVLGLALARAVPSRRADAVAELSRAVTLDPANHEASDDLARLRAE